MRLAICNEMFVDWPFDRAFAVVRQCGYTGIEIAPFTLTGGADPCDVADIPAARRAEVRRQAAAAGLEVVGLHWILAKTEGLHLTSPQAAVRRRTAAYLGEVVRLCRDLGGTIMVFGSPLQRNLVEGVTHQTGMKFAAEVLQEVMPLCEQTETVIALEPLAPTEGNFLLTASSGIDLVRMVDSPHCQLHLDCKAMASESRPIPELIRASRDYLVHFHANDPNRLSPGMGQLQFPPIFAALREIDYRGWVSVEVFDYTPGADEIARASIEHMRSVLAELDRGGGAT